MASARQKQQLGRLGEDLALAHLEQKGYQILAKNQREGRGEIDLIAQEGNYLVFVEVKTRQQTPRGGRPEDPLLNMTKAKVKSLRQTAELYLIRTGITGLQPRFDVITLSIRSGEDFDLEHIIHAF